MVNSSVLTSKGQLTVPQEIRKRLGLREGDRVEFILGNGVAILRPARGQKNPFAPYAGALGTFTDGIGEIKSWIRELRG
jgi:antitoxin PrlF